MFSLSPIKIWRWHCVLLGHHWLKSRIWSSLQNHRYCCQSMAIHSICLIAKSWCVCGLFIICLRLKTTTLNLRLFLFPFRGHAQHPAAHVRPGTIHLHAAVKSLPWQRETSGSHIHRRPVWQSNHTGRSPELQPNGFKWTDNWLFTGACGKQNLLLFHNSLIIVCLCKGGEIISVTHRSTEWPTCTIFTCARVASATRGHVSPSSGWPVSGWRGTCRWEMKERENCQSRLRACVGRMKRLSLSLSFSLQGRPRLWRQHRHSGWPADRICSSVLRLHVNIWRLSKVPELCGGVLRGETHQSRPREATGVKKSCCSVRGLQWISFNQNY